MIYCSIQTMKRGSSSRASHSESSSECGDDDHCDDEDSSFSSAERKPSYISKKSSSSAHNHGHEQIAIADNLVNDTTTTSSFLSPVLTVWKAADDTVDTGSTSATLSDYNPTSHHHHKKKKRKVKAAFKDGKPHGLLQAKWDEMFNRLVTYKVKHGNCLVPNRYKGDASLGAWVSTQRRQYKILTTGSYESTPMTPDRAQRLESLGFIWATKDPRHVPWDRRLQELVAFKKKYGVSAELVPLHSTFYSFRITLIIPKVTYIVLLQSSIALFQLDMRYVYNNSFCLLLYLQNHLYGLQHSLNSRFAWSTTFI